MKIQFDNTELAFKHKSNRSLRKAYYLFLAFKSKFLVNKGHIISEWCFKLRIPIKGIVKKTIFEQFCGGETVDECNQIAEKLKRQNIGSILDYSVEGKSEENTFDRTFQTISRVIKNTSENKFFPFTVFKPTGIGSGDLMEKVSSGETLKDEEKLLYANFEDRFNALCKLAYEQDNPILVDAEETWFQNAIDGLVYGAMKRYNKEKPIIFNTVQLYKKKQIPYIEKQINEAKKNNYFLGIKLVRGAYLEKENSRAESLGIESPIQNTKEDTDRDYDQAVVLCFENRSIVSFMAATHNEKSSALLAELIIKEKISPNDKRFFFGQLYGMSDHISYTLAPLGFNVTKYLPFGPVRDVLPYLSRRAQENSSIKGQSSRELDLIQKELKRRKLAKA